MQLGYLPLHSPPAGPRPTAFGMLGANDYTLEHRGLLEGPKHPTMSNHRGGRWGPSSNNRPSPPQVNEDDLAMAALLGEANKKSEEEERARKQQQYKSRQNNNHRLPQNNKRQHNNNNNANDTNNYYGRSSGDKRIVEDDTDEQRDTKRSKQSSTEEQQSAPENPNKVKADFGLSGALAGDTQTGNVYNGVTLKFSEPPEARIPNTRWRLYVFRKKNPDSANKNDDGLLDTYHISRQSAYLFGRERKVADIPVDHGSLSKQHAVLQYRSLPSKQQEIGAPTKLQCKPYLMDLESTNGTFINGVRLDSARYYELKRGDVLSFGASSREYVLLTEQTKK